MTTTLAPHAEPRGRRDGRHWIVPAGPTWTPPVVAFFDTETVPEMVGDDEVQRLRLWVASVVVRRHKTPARVGATTGTGTTGAELAAWLGAECARHDTVWLFAHNLGFDLTTTRLVTHLVAAGWSLSSIVLAGKSAVVRMAHGSRRLCMVDSWSWLQAPLAEIGRAVEVEKPPLPDFSDDDAAWLHRCTGDVEVLGKAILTLLDWWEECDLGHFGVTGASTGWSTLRRRLRPYTLMADPTPQVRRLERRAIFGGRRDICRWGDQEAGPWVQLDFENAYASVARSVALPTIPQGWDDTVTTAQLADPPEAVGWLAEVTVRAERPSWPARWGPDVVLPVGTFRTVLAGPELAVAARDGAVLDVHRALRYRTTTALSDWAQWVIGVARGEGRDDPPVARMAAKGWSRSALGKTAGRISVVHDRGPAWSPGWAAAPGWDHAAGAPAMLLTVAGRRLWTVREQEGATAVPAVFAWVESAVRWRLRAVLDALGEGTWVQADTDGCICSVPALRRWLRTRGVHTAALRSPMAVAAAACDELVATCEPLVLRPKGLWDRLELVGPQHLRTEGRSRLSGIRSDSTPTGPRSYAGRTWPGLLWQMQHGDRHGYVRPRAVWTLPVVTAHRWATATGALWPLEARMGAGGALEVVPWPETALAASGRALAASQWRRLGDLA
jgi:hypothetical protein